MRKLSTITKKRIDEDNYYRQCCICGSKLVQMHHNLIFAGRQADDPETILPLCEYDHDQARNSDFKEKLDWIMYNRMTPEQLVKYNKSGDLMRRFNYLKTKFDK